MIPSCDSKPYPSQSTAQGFTFLHSMGCQRGSPGLANDGLFLLALLISMAYVREMELALG